MNIEKLSECTNASKFGTCSECGVSESDTHNLYRLKFNGVSVCLCPDCFSNARQKLNNVKLQGRSEVENDKRGSMEKIKGILV